MRTGWNVADASILLIAFSDFEKMKTRTSMGRLLPLLLALQVSILFALTAEAYSAVHARPKRYVDKYLKARQGHHMFRAAPFMLAHEGDSPVNYHSDRFSYEADEGIEKIMRASNPRISRELAELYKRHIVKWARHYSLPPLLVASVIHVESNFNVDCYYLGNYGPMQVNLTVHKDRLRRMGLGVEDLKTVEHGVYVGCDILKECIFGSGGNYVRALTWYNGAMDPAYASKVLRMYSYGKGRSE